MAAKRATLMVSLFGLLPGLAMAQAQQLTGGEIRDRMINATIEGTNLQGKYQETYRADGTIEGLLEGQAYDGKWDVKGDQMCFYYNDMLFACSGIQIDGTKLNFLSSGEVVAEATYAPPKPVETAAAAPPATPVPPPPVDVPAPPAAPPPEATATPPAPPAVPVAPAETTAADPATPPGTDERAVIPVPVPATPALPTEQAASIDGGAKPAPGITVRPPTIPGTPPSAPAVDVPAVEALVTPPVPVPGVPTGAPSSPKAEIEQILRDFAPEMQVVVGDVVENGNDLLISRIDIEIERGLIALEDISILGGNRENAKAIFNPDSYAGGPRAADFLPLFDRMTVKRLIVSPPDAPTSTFGTFSVAALSAKPFAKAPPTTAQGMESVDESQALDIAQSIRYAGITFDDLFVAVPSGHPDPVNPADAQYFMRTGRIAIGAYDPQKGMVPESIAVEKIDMKVPNPQTGGDVPLTLARASISNVRFHEDYPIAGRVEVLGLSTPSSVADDAEARELFKAIGLDKLEFDAVLDIGADVDAKTSAINEFSVRWAGMGAMTMGVALGQVDIPSAIAGANPMVMLAATLVGANFSYTDDGGLEKILIAGSKESGQSPADLRQGLIQQVEQTKGMATHPALAKAFDDAISFLRRPGTFEVALKPAQPVPLATFASDQPPDPNKVVDTVGLTTSVR
ncbi:hypothetical protein [Zavarzinia sp. CC-PAN008]|uniref:hypothetical protein n=1 Tax=Zavarzinia sp. CC-PAN008 TaxID=3243332 RepID=UPI003F74603E